MSCRESKAQYSPESGCSGGRLLSSLPAGRPRNGNLIPRLTPARYRRCSHSLGATILSPNSRHDTNLGTNLHRRTLHKSGVQHFQISPRKHTSGENFSLNYGDILLLGEYSYMPSHFQNNPLLYRIISSMLEKLSHFFFPGLKRFASLAFHVLSRV